MISTFYPPYHFGGDATYIRALSRALVDRGHEVEVIHCTDAYAVSHPAPPATAGAKDDRVTVHRLASPFGMLSPLLTQQTGHPGFKFAALKKILSREFDVVHFHNISLVGGPSVLGLSNAPVTLYTLHDHWLLCPTHIFWKNKTHNCDHKQCLRCSLRSGIPPQLWRYTGLIRRSLAKVDSIIAPSKYTAQKHRLELAEDIHVLPLFSSIDPGVFTEFKPASRPRFVYTGRITLSKGILPLVETFSALHDYDLEVIGDGDLLEEIRREYSHCENIRFRGRVKQRELVQFYQNATALILPSLVPETFGLAVVEAFACGTPAIVSDSGGSRELIDATGAGYVYKTNEDLLSMVKRLAADTALRRGLGRKAREGFDRTYTQNHHLEGYLSHIATVQKRNGVILH